MELICITKIHSVYYVPAEQYREAKTVLDPHLPFNELICYLDHTDSTTRIGSYTIENRPGKIVLYPAGEWERYTVQRRAFAPCLDIFFTTEAPLPHVISEYEPLQTAALVPLFQKAHRLWNRSDTSAYYAVMGLVYEIMAGLADARQKAYLPSRKAFLLAPAEAYLEQHLFSPAFSYRDLRESAGISYTYFYQLFSQKYGMSPEKYVETKRLERAAAYLQTKRFSVTQIAEAVGYGSVYYFSRAFRKRFGLSPTQYQKEK